MSHSMTVTAQAAKRAAHRRPGLPALLALYRQRRQLARLDESALRDIGVTRAEAEAEAARAPWDAPAHWMR